MPIVPSGKVRQQVAQGPMKYAEIHESNFMKRFGMLDGLNEDTPGAAGIADPVAEVPEVPSDLQATMNDSNDQRLNAGVRGITMSELINELAPLIQGNTREVRKSGQPDGQEWTVEIHPIPGKFDDVSEQIVNYKKKNNLGIQIDVEAIVSGTVPKGKLDNTITITPIVQNTAETEGVVVDKP